MSARRTRGPLRPAPIVRWPTLMLFSLALAASGRVLGAQQVPAAPKAATPLSAILGVVDDSIRGGHLAGAVIAVEGTPRHTVSDGNGAYRIDSLPPGTYRLTISHPLLDTLGFGLASASITLSQPGTSVVALGIPSPSTLRRSLCPGRDTVQTPSLLLGRVRDADTDAPATGTKVSLVYEQLIASMTTGIHRMLRVREAMVKPNGTYVICGLPAELHGTLQAQRGSASTAEVPIVFDDEMIGLRSLSIGSQQTVVAAAPAAPPGEKAPAGAAPAAEATGLQSGQAVVSGRVLDSLGHPVAGAQVAVTSTAASTLTAADGVFTLRGLPSGTRELVVRRLGYAAASVPVELTVRQPQQVAVRLHKAAPQLAPVRVEARADVSLDRIGFTDRRKLGFGHFITPQDIDRQRPRVLTDLLAVSPGFDITESNGQRVVSPTRSPSGMSGSCVNYFVDRAPWVSANPGDLDAAFPITDIAAIETYPGSVVPMEFTVPGSNCATIVIWTRTMLGKH